MLNCRVVTFRHVGQVAADLSQAFPTSANEALCLELLGVLRRCLTQQAAVRDTLYAGLHEVLSRNPELAESLLTMLQQQLETLLETRPAAPPLVLSRCIQASVAPWAVVECCCWCSLTSFSYRSEKGLFL